MRAEGWSSFFESDSTAFTSFQVKVEGADVIAAKAPKSTASDPRAPNKRPAYRSEGCLGLAEAAAGSETGLVLTHHDSESAQKS